MKRRCVFVCCLALASCAVLIPPVKEMPKDHGTPELAALKPEIGQLFAVDVPNVKVLKINIADDQWNIERSPEGAILRRSVTAAIAWQQTDSCRMGHWIFREESTGPNAWGPLRTWAGEPKARKIDCALVADDAPTAR
jgi:hypothetical protein